MEEISFNNHLNEENHPANKIGIFRTSDYDLDIGERKAKYKDYDRVLCEKCSHEIYNYSNGFLCANCYNKETDSCERIHIRYGNSKVGIFKTLDYDLNRNQRQAKYEDYDYVLCEKCDQEISKFYCKHCYYNEESNVYKRIHIKYGKSKIGIFKILVCALDWKQR